MGSGFLLGKREEIKVRKIFEWCSKHTWKTMAILWGAIAIINIFKRDISMIDYVLPVILLIFEYWHRDKLK